MNKVLATDLDGTLFYPKQSRRCISKKNVEFIRKWIDAGNKFVVISSRSLQFLQRLKSEIDRPFDILASTGSQQIIDNTLARDEKMNNVELQDLLKRIDRKYKPMAFLMTTKNYPCVIKNNRGVGKILASIYKLWWYAQGPYKEPMFVSNSTFQRELNEGDIYKIMVFFGLSHKKDKFAYELNKSLREEFKEFEFSWIYQVVEITPYGCSKGEGMEFYCKHRGIDYKDVYVIGDSGNDISMFKTFQENSFVMKHASPRVKKYAAYVVPSVHSLEKYLLT